MKYNSSSTTWKVNNYPLLRYQQQFRTVSKQKNEPEHSHKNRIRELHHENLGPIVIHQKKRFNMLVSKLSDIRSSVPNEYQSDIIMKNKLLNSIKNIESCKLAYQKPASTIQGVIADIYSALATSLSTFSMSTGDAESLYADSRFHNRNFLVVIYQTIKHTIIENLPINVA